MQKSIKRSAKWVLGLLLLAALAWAAAELSGQANKAAADAGSNSADTEMASLDMVKPSTKAPNCDWQLEKSLKGQIDQKDKEYVGLVNQAKSEIEKTGKVADATKSKVQKAAAEFKALNDSYADMWSKCNCKTRSKLAREVGATRIKSADVVVSEINSDKIKELEAQQAKMNAARQEYVAEAKTDLSPADKAAVKASVGPRLQKTGSNLASLAQQITGLMDQVKGQATKGGGLSALGGMASGGGPSALLSPLQSLMSMVQSMIGNVKNMTSDLTAIGG
jgi:hypothetical protein